MGASCAMWLFATIGNSAYERPRRLALRFPAAGSYNHCNRDIPRGAQSGLLVGTAILRRQPALDSAAPCAQRLAIPADV
jgi:hypothetical protein